MYALIQCDSYNTYVYYKGYILITVRHNDATFALQDSLFTMRLLSLDEVRTQRDKVYSALVLQRVALISVRKKIGLINSRRM